DTKMRVLHLSLWPCTIQDFKEDIRMARFGHFNTLIVLNHYGVDLQSLQHLDIEGETKWSIAEFQQMVRFAQENGLEVIPELKLLSHQGKFIKDSHPQYMYNKATYDPRKKELYKKIVFPAIDELLLLTGATKFHIGHDEVAGWHEVHYRKELLRKGEKQLPPELFLQDVLTLHEYLKGKGVETWMWGDMLVSREEFPSMGDSGANLNGYNGYAALRERIPKDIVICDWHYRGKQVSFPTALAFATNGNKVLGATWEFHETTKNFTKYMAQLPLNNEGMIATTWYGLSGKKKEEVQNIIKFSGETFWNANQ
nr:family 20 glycosylhydrolase [Desulfobacula sp.]